MRDGIYPHVIKIAKFRSRSSDACLYMYLFNVALG